MDAIFLDIDGTLWDSTHTVAKAWNQVLETKEEIYRFLEDVLTIQEMKSITQRLEVAVMLREKETYQEIVRKTGASTTTIGRVNRALQYGADGYDIVLSRLTDVTDAPQK